MLLNNRLANSLLVLFFGILMTYQNCVPSGAGYKISVTNINSDDQAALQNLESQIDEILDQDYCSQPSDCEAIGIGTKPCGGPRAYIVNSSNNHRSELQTLVEDYNLLESKINQASGAISTCEYLMPPQEILCLQNKCTLDQ